MIAPRRIAEFYAAGVWGAAVAAGPRRPDALDMSLLDKTPGGFITVANTVLYGTVLAETWMLTTDSLVAMTAVMGLIIAVSGLLVRWMGNLMGSEEYTLGEAPKTAKAPVAATAAAPRQRVRTTSRAAHA